MWHLEDIIPATKGIFYIYRYVCRQHRLYFWSLVYIILIIKRYPLHIPFCFLMSPLFLTSRNFWGLQSQQQKQYKKLWKMFKVNNKNTRTTSMTLFWYVFIDKLEHLSYLCLVFTVYFEQLDASWNWTINVHCIENCLKRTPIEPKQVVRLTQGVNFREGFRKMRLKWKKPHKQSRAWNIKHSIYGISNIPFSTKLISLLISKLFELSIKTGKIFLFLKK